MLGPGEEKTYYKDCILTDDLGNSGDPLPPGIYQLTAIINSSVTIVSEPLDIEIQGYEQDIILYKGWNFISLPCMPVNQDMSIILKSIWPYIESIWTYNESTKLFYVLDHPYYPHTMEIGKAYWIHVSQDVILNIVGRFIYDSYVPITLRPGWNFVGFNSAFSMPVAQAMSSVSYNSINSIYTYESMEGQWFGEGPLMPPFMDGLSYFEPGKGYCIYVNSNCVWDIRKTGQ